MSQFRQRREELGLSQIEVAGRIGVQEHLVAKWETCNRKPTLFHAFCWAQVLEAEIELSRNECRVIGQRERTAC